MYKVISSYITWVLSLLLLMEVFGRNVDNSVKFKNCTYNTLNLLTELATALGSPNLDINCGLHSYHTLNYKKYSSKLTLTKINMLYERSHSIFNHLAKGVM